MGGQRLRWSSLARGCGAERCLALYVALVAGCGDDAVRSPGADLGADATTAADAAVDTAPTEVANAAPTAQIIAPAADVDLVVGASVAFAGRCVDPDGDGVSHRWSFGDSGLDDVLAAETGPVAFARAGAFVVRYACTDAAGLASAPVERRVTVAAEAGYALSGVITFDKVPSRLSGLDYARIEVRPLRGVEVRVVAADDPGLVVASTETDDGGRYVASWARGGPTRVRVVALARTAAPIITVSDNTAGNALFSLASPALDVARAGDGATLDLHASSGWTGSGYVARAAAPFAVLDAATEAVRAFLAVRPELRFPALPIYWSEDNAPTAAAEGESDSEAYAVGHIGTSHWNGVGLYLLGLEDVDSDEFDDHVIVHEWGHYFESRIGRSDGPGGDHGPGFAEDPRVAFTEGWATGLSAVVWAPQTTYTDSFGEGQAEGFGYDVEEGTADDPDPGWYSEASVQALVLDLADDSGAAEPSDGVALGLGALADVLTGAQKETPALTSVYSFVAGLKDANPEAADAIDQLMLARGIVGVPVADAFGTGEVHDGGDARNLPLFARLGSAPVEVELIGSEFYNTLGGTRFLRFTGDGRRHRVGIATSGGQDVDVTVYRQGEVLSVAQSESGTEETPEFATESGVEHVVLVAGYSLFADCTTTVTLDPKPTAPVAIQAAIDGLEAEVTVRLAAPARDVDVRVRGVRGADVAAVQDVPGAETLTRRVTLRRAPPGGLLVVEVHATFAGQRRARVASFEVGAVGAVVPRGTPRLEAVVGHERVRWHEASRRSPER